LLVFGLGGIYVNLFQDFSLRLAQNLEEPDIDEMIKETKAYHLLRGFRGSNPLDIQSLKDTLLKTASLVTTFPEIREMDINPLLVYEKGVCAVDVKITLSHNLVADVHPVWEREEQLIEQFAERRS
jgi:acetyltransferase